MKTKPPTAASNLATTWRKRAGRLSSLGILAAVSLCYANVAPAAVISRTYSLSSYPLDQAGATLSGSITVVFESTAGLAGGVVPMGGAGTDFVLLQTSNPVTTWNFTVDKPGQASYTVGSTDAGAAVWNQDLSLLSTPTTLSLGGGADLTIGLSPGVTTETVVTWLRSPVTDQYLANYVGNVSPRGWITPNPQNIAGDGSGGWIIGTAVPEPGTAVVLSGALLGLACRRRR